MIKIEPPNSESYHNFKCGEIYCYAAFTYKVNCCVCGNQVDFEDFLHHFKSDHMSETDELKDPVKIEDFLNQEMHFQHETQASVDVEELEVNPINIDLDASEPGQYTSKIDSDYEHENDGGWKADEDTGENNTCPEKTSNDWERPFQCSKCERAYRSKRGLSNHLRIDHNPQRPKETPKKCENVKKCEQCGESFPTERHLRRHMWKHTDISCDICGKTFTQPGHLKKHKIRHTGIKAYRCQECEFSFYTKEELKSHMLKHTQKFQFVCEICGRRCRDHADLKAHMRRHTGERPAKCQHCGKSFFSIHDLNNHAVTHTSERPFACEVCGSTFQLKNGLRKHKKLHSTERILCKICGKAFKQSNGLYQHMKTHQACAKSSQNNDALEQPAELLSLMFN